MEIKAFNLIADSVESILKPQNFAGKKTDISSNIKTAVFEGEAIAYKISFDCDSHKYELSSCAMTDDGPDDSWKSLSTWLFDPSSDRLQDAQDIANDFTSTLQGPKRTKLVKSSKRKSKSDESNADPLFFMNRLVNVFPELKADIKYEKENYEYFRGVTFAKEKVLPLISELLVRTDGAKLKKLSKILSDMYSAGDLDTRGIITYVILSDLDNKNNFSLLWELLSPDLQKAFTNTRKLHGKTIKPEKQKKPSKLSSANTLVGH